MGLCASQFCRHLVAGKFSRAPRCWFKRKWLFRRSWNPSLFGGHSQHKKLVESYSAVLHMDCRPRKIPSHSKPGWNGFVTGAGSPGFAVPNMSQHLRLQHLQLYSISLGSMLGLTSGCGSWSRSWSRWSPGPWKSSKWKWLTSCTSISEEKQVLKQQDLMERLHAFETQLRWGRVGKACASMHQLKLAELNEGKRFIIFPRASIPLVYPIFRHKWRIQQDAKHQKFEAELWSRPTAVLCALKKAHVWLVESPFCLVCIGWINMFVCENCGCVLTAPVLVLFKVQFWFVKWPFCLQSVSPLPTLEVQRMGRKSGARTWLSGHGIPVGQGDLGAHRKSPWWFVASFSLNQMQLECYLRIRKVAVQGP